MLLRKILIAIEIAMLVVIIFTLGAEAGKREMYSDLDPTRLEIWEENDLLMVQTPDGNVWMYNAVI